MKSSIRKYLFLPLIFLLSGLGHVNSHMVINDFSQNLSVFSENHIQKQNQYDKDISHHKNGASGYEIVEQNSFQKDWIDDVPFRVFGLKNYTNSLFNLLSRRLSLNKPFLVQYSGDALYKAIRVFRL